jgi:PPOX class probable F420-dependent enzyme
MLRLSDDEVWSHLAAAHTGIVTTLRRDGMPVSLPVWFVADGRTLVFSTPSGSKKIARVRRDPRAAFLVESGRRWRELTAIHLTGEIEVVREDAEIRRLEVMLNDKYAPYRDLEAMPAQSQGVYVAKTYLRLHPHERVLSWDNSRIAERAR